MKNPEEGISGRRVILKHPSRDDLAYIRQLWRDPVTMKEVGGPIDYSEEKMLDWYRRQVDPGGPANCYFLIYNEDDRPIGEVSYHRWDASRREACLNIKIEWRQRGKGYASDALTAFLAFYFMTISGERMVYELAPRNLGAKHFLEKFGFSEQPGREDPRLMLLSREVYLQRTRAYGR